VTLRTLVGLLVLLAAPAAASAQESQLASDVRREGEHLAESCSLSLKGVALCTYSLITESPFHIALGNLPPQNGFALGGAFTEHYTPNESWRLSFGADAVRAAGGSWRAGASMKMIHTPATSGVVVAAPGTAPGSATIRPRQFTVIDVAYQTISLQQVSFYGLGPDSREEDRAVYGETHSSLGVSVIYPLGHRKGFTGLQPSLLGGVNGRWIAIRSGQPDDGPSIETRYDDASAPGLSGQDPFLELHGGVRLTPSLANGRLALNYLLRGQYFRTSDTTTGSFTRWTADLRHDIPIYRQVASTGPRDVNGPNDCGTSATTPRCPPVQWSRNRTGTISLRALASTSPLGELDRVPFYLQRTMGGSDLNGDRLLTAFDDYRFRAPNLLAFQEGLEHSIWGPVGAFVEAEQGSVALHAGDLGSRFRSSATVGLTIRAGGAPAIVLAFAWGSEGNHALARMDAALLGGGRRPSLF